MALKLGFPCVLKLKPLFSNNGTLVDVPPKSLPLDLDLDLAGYAFELQQKGIVVMRGGVNKPVGCFSLVSAVCSALNWQVAHTLHYSDNAMMRFSHVKAFYSFMPPPPPITDVGQAYTRPTDDFKGFILSCRAQTRPDEVIELTMDCPKPETDQLAAAARHLNNTCRIDWMS